MQIHIGAIGKLKKGAEKALADEYFSRIQKIGKSAGIRDLKIAEYPESQAETAKLRKSDEADRLLAGCPQDAVYLVLDEHGENANSQELAKLIGKICDDGTKTLGVLIGGPDGHDATLLSKANHKLALGRLTWPHRLVRIMLAEQLYRSVTILLNHPYHRN